MPRHPELNLIDTVCATCGTTFMVRSPAESLSLDICSNCHPAAPECSAQPHAVTGSSASTDAALSRPSPREVIERAGDIEFARRRVHEAVTFTADTGV